jgi:heme A synthase
VLLAVEVGQGAIGFVQYFTDLPVVLVGFHMLGASLVTAAMTWTLLAVREQEPPGQFSPTSSPPRGHPLPLRRGSRS